MATRTWECWASEEDGSLTLATVENARKLFASGGLGKAPVLQYSFEAATAEEASAIHNLRQGFAPYQPIGDPAPCPACGATIYPEGSGDCWQCLQ
jgi:hypothetical protein